MKRNHAIERALKMHYWDPPFNLPAEKIPPRSIVRFTNEGLVDGLDLQLGAVFRVGYYSRQDGPNCVWLVNNEGEYCQTWDQLTIRSNFDVVSLSEETDIFGNNRPEIEPLR